MRSPVLILLFSLFTFHLSLVRAQSVSEIPVAAGEKWWGLFAGNSPEQPFAGPLRTMTAVPTPVGFCTGNLISSTGRYIHSDEPVSLAFDGRKFTAISPGETKVVAVKGGRTLRQAFLAMHHRNFKETGTHPSPELFTNPVYETQSGFGFLQTAAGVLSYARRLLDEGFPAGIMVLADGWRIASGYGFDPGAYPDPTDFMDEMHRMGFRVMLTVTPYIPAWGRDFAGLHKGGMLVAGDDGQPLMMENADGMFAAVDLTAPMQTYGLKEALTALQRDFGVDGFRFDCRKLMDAVSWPVRAKYLMAVQETGSEFELVEFIPGMPEFQTKYVSAVNTMKHDAVGYMTDVAVAGIAAGPFTQVLPWPQPAEDDENAAVRYALMQTMQPVWRVPFAPWKYSFAVDEMRRVMAFRASVSEYMGAAFDEACKTVEPIVRPMEYNFPNSGFADCADQYMLGDKYLVVPATEGSYKRLIRLPRGAWRDASGRRHRGPAVIEAATDGYKMTWFELL